MRYTITQNLLKLAAHGPTLARQLNVARAIFGSPYICK